VERFNLRKLNEVQVRKQYHIMISNRFAALENVTDSEDIIRFWENIKENLIPHLKRVSVCINSSNINHVVMKNFYNSRSKKAG